jgi:hypothetical protein
MAARELLAAAIRWGEEIPPDRVIVIDEEKRELLTVFTTEVLPDPIRKRLRWLYGARFVFRIALHLRSAREILGPTPLLAIEDEHAPDLIVDPPLAGPLSRGAVFIQYRTRNMRIVPVFGAGALDVSPRIGHLHLTVDDAPWHFVDSSGSTVIIVGLQPGPHRMLFELADPVHRVVCKRTIEFVVPKPDSS